MVFLFFFYSEDDVVSYEHGERCGNFLHGTGFINLTFWKIDGYIHTLSFAQMREEIIAL